MKITMQNVERLTLAEMQEFVASSGSLSFTGADRKRSTALSSTPYRRTSTCGWRRKTKASCVAIWPSSAGADDAPDPALTDNALVKGKNGAVVRKHIGQVNRVMCSHQSLAPDRMGLS